MLRVGVLVSGGGTNLQAIIDAQKAGKITNTEIVTIVSNNPSAGALDRGNKEGIEAMAICPKDYPSREAFFQNLIEHLKTREVELIVLAGYLVVLSEAFIQAFRGRIINIHPSLIPAFSGKGYYGLRVHEAALKRGVKLTGATVHFVDEGTDTGPIIAQKAVPVWAGDTPETLQRRVMEEAEWRLLPEAIDAIANGRIEFGSNLAYTQEEKG